MQGLFTEIHEDEAYYALFGEHLAWGYFDHPPMVALMTFLSGLLFSGTLGVRFCTIVVSCITILIMWHLLGEDKPDKNKVILFFVLTFSILMVNLYGFITTPDAALLLFSALFLLVYKRYLEDDSWKNALLMGLLMALMVYSKYHAFLLLGLIVLSNLKLLKDGKFYVACLLALAVLMPHILWQINADFPSFRYHLSGRSESFQWSYFFEYLPNQLLVFNPFVFGAVVYALIRHKDKDRFERGLKFILVGFFFFFWLMTFRGHVEPHWTAVCIIPSVILLYRKALVDSKLMKYTQWVIAPSLLLMVFVRIALLTPLSTSFGFYGKEAHYKAVESVAGDSPVVFQGSFQKPALYHFFSGKESSSLRCYYDRMTQFDLWQFDKAWIGKPVFVYGASGSLSQEYHFGNEQFIGYKTEHFMTANRVETKFEITNLGKEILPMFRSGDTLQIDFSIFNPCDQAVVVQSEMVLKLLLVDENDVRYCIHDPIPDLKPKETYKGHLSVVLSDMEAGKHRVVLCVGDRIANFAAVEDAVEIEVEF